MSARRLKLSQAWQLLSPRYLPFADAASPQLPLSRLLRLSLFQVSVGMATVLLTGTLNRVMIVELNIPASIVALMVAIPLVFAPLRALIGFKSDTHRSVLGWRRVPYIWIGSMLQFGGFAIMPFALLVLSGDTHGPLWIGQAGAMLAFLLVGAGLHTTQTAGLALASDLAPAEMRPRVVSLLYVMLLVGMLASALAFGAALTDFTQIKLIQVIQGAAVITIVLNAISLWKQEPRSSRYARATGRKIRFADAWREFSSGGRASRLLLAVGLGTAAFAMQDVLLEPYGGEILGMSVSETTVLTALLAGGGLAGFVLAARFLAHGGNPYRLAAIGALVGIPAFTAVIFAATLQSEILFQFGTMMIGLGGGLFAVGTLTAAMGLARRGESGLVLAAWGAVHATAAGGAIAAGGLIRDSFTTLAETGSLGPALTEPVVGYGVVYHFEIALLFLTLAVIGPIVRTGRTLNDQPASRLGLAELPG